MRANRVFASKIYDEAHDLLTQILDKGIWRAMEGLYGLQPTKVCEILVLDGKEYASNNNPSLIKTLVETLFPTYYDVVQKTLRPRHYGEKPEYYYTYGQIPYEHPDLSTHQPLLISDKSVIRSKNKAVIEAIALFNLLMDENPDASHTH